VESAVTGDDPDHRHHRQSVSVAVSPDPPLPKTDPFDEGTAERQRG